MSVTRIVLVCSVIVLGFCCFLAAIGFTAIVAPLVTVAVLVVLVAGGNLVSGRPSSPRPAPPARPAERHEGEG